MKLDGTDTIKPTPFDAHEQVVRAPHTHEAPANASAEAHEASGYKPADYEHQEYPKAVAHDKETGDPVIAKDEAHEAELLAGKGE